MFLYLKAAHIIFVVTWFAGLFYIVRLFVYLAETAERPEEERRILEPQLQLMAKRLWMGIAWPSAVVTLVLGGWLLSFYPSVPTWLWIKLGLVGLLFAYHLACHGLYRRFARGETPATPMQMRIWNEVATLLLVAIVFLVVLKGTLEVLTGVLGLVAVALLLSGGIAIYRRVRLSSGRG